MTTQIEAVYEQGMLRLLRPLALQEGERVELVLLHRRAKSLRPSPAERLAMIAALPDDPGTDSFSNRRHDEVLYGERTEE